MHAVSRAAQHRFRPGPSITPPHACRHRHRPPNPKGNGGVFATPLGTVALWIGLLPAVAVVGQVPKNTQKAGEHPPSAQEAVKRISVPPGFQVTLFAAEPDVRQPIAIDLDDRGRLWVAQCDTYEGGPYDTNYEDQILILEDTDGDGIHDRRTLFWKGRGPLTGLTWGFGGLWVLCAGELRFLPDRDRDDRPDGEPEVHLDGWDYLHTRHNVVNGLQWGPDGWLYGRHGITDVSAVGVPGTPPDKRTVLDCSIWRYHPLEHRFEVVCRGTTNPWGFDYDETGEWSAGW